MKTSNLVTAVNSVNCKNQPVAAFQNQAYLELTRRQTKERVILFEDLKEISQVLYKSRFYFSTFHST